MHDKAWDETRGLKHVNELLKERNNYLEQLMMQLRVYSMDDGIRTGFAITAFIPSDVLAYVKKGLPAARNDLVTHVARVLVHRAIKGLWNLQGVDQKVTAIVFEPIGRSAQASTWVEGGKRPIHIAPMVDGPQTVAWKNNLLQQSISDIKREARRMSELSDKHNRPALPREAESEL